MRHHNANRKFGRKTTERRAFLRSLVRALVHEEKITTTGMRAKELRPMVEKLITRGKSPTIANRRLLVARLGGDEETAKKIETIAKKYDGRAGGYTRITKIPTRKSDGSTMAVIEFV